MAGIVAKSYCEALFEIAKEDNKLDMFKEQLCLIQKTLEDEPKYRFVMNHPKISKQEKKILLDVIYGEYIDHTLLNFIRLLVDKNRFVNIGDICKEYIKAYNKENNIQVVYVKSASALKREEVEKLEAALVKKLDKKVDLVLSLDEELMAGIRIKINDQIIDNSAKSRLQRLKKQIILSEEMK